MTRTAISTSAPVFPAGVSYYPVDSARTTLTGPIPTNAWFENFLLGTGQQPINIFPYMVKVTTQGLDFCVPQANTSFPNAVLATMLQNFSLRATATSTAQKLTAFTDLGATLTWTLPGGSMAATIVRGAAYVTMNYSGVTPVVNTQNAILTMNGTAVGSTGTFTGTKFKVTLNNGQTWILYTSASVTLTLSTANTLTAGAAFTGTFRMALLPTGATEATLDSSATRIHTGGTVDYTIASNTATEVYTWSSTGTGTLLTYALPHHQDWLSSPSYPTGFTLSTLRGSARAVLGYSWSLAIPLPTTSWNNANPIDASRLSAVTTALASDKTFVPQVSDTYFGGKQLAKAARLALIADQVGDTTARNTLLNNLKAVINQYLAGNLSTSLRYDTMWKGIVSAAGLTNQDSDFGNGRYNDHNFHYGYVIYAAAVIAKFDGAWLTTYQTTINDLVRDIANPSATDTWFTPMRCFDWYEGHSWAAGTFEFGDNRNQESTSEAVNAWYGLHLWGVASSQTQLTELGRLLLAQEAATAKRYWQIKQSDTIYPEPFNDHGVVGILWSNKVDYATWFGAQAEYIFGIQMLPTIPATELLIPDDWIAEVWASKLSALWTRTSVWRAELLNGGSGYTAAQFSPTGQGYTNGLVASGGTGSGLGFNVNITAGQIIGVYIIFDQHGTGYTNGETITLNGSGGSGAQVRVWTQPEDGWKAVILGAYSQVNPDDAWTKTLALSSFDDGSSKTQALVHIASQTTSTAKTLSGAAQSTSTTTGALGLSSSKSLSGTARSVSTTSQTALGQPMTLAGSALSLSRTILTIVLVPWLEEPPDPVDPETPVDTSFLRDDPRQFLIGVIRSGPGHYDLTLGQLEEIYDRIKAGEEPRRIGIEFAIPNSVMAKVVNRLNLP
jgi:endo-1,3(4)-beta-glucanase